MFDTPQFTERDVPDAAKDRPPTRDQYVKETFPLPAGWDFYAWEAKGEKPDDYVLVSGAVCNAVYERGPKKGRKNWSKMVKATDMTFPVSEKVFQAWIDRWQKETGLCAECMGSGRAWAGWNCNHGTHYRTCHHCGGTGKPSISQAA